MSEGFTKFTAFENESKDEKSLKWRNTALQGTAKDGFKITCKTRPIGKCTLVETKITFENVDIKKLITAYIDLYDIDEDLKDYKLIEKKENSTVHYCSYDIPIPFVSDRDMVIEMHNPEEVEGGTFVCACDVEHPDMPVNKKNYRMTLWSGTLFKQEGSDVTALSYEHCDAGNKLLNGFDADSTVGDAMMVLKKMQMNG